MFTLERFLLPLNARNMLLEVTFGWESLLTNLLFREHGQDNHDRRFTKQEIINNTEIMKKDNCANNLRIMEAILIKKHKPSINRKDEGRTRTLMIF